MEYQIRSSHPSYDDQDKKFLLNVLKRSYTAEGPETDAFLDELTNFIGLDEGVAASSGTAAFHLFLKALGIGPGDEVILPSYTCQSLLHPVYHVGAKPILADVDPESYSLISETVKPKLTEQTALIVLVHSFGYPVEDDELFDLNVPVLEDLANAIGSRRDEGNHVGTQGIAALGSLYATKQISAGLGGFVCTNNRALVDEIEDLKTYDERETYRPAYNYSWSDLNAALARSQLRKVPSRLKDRRDLADFYEKALADVDQVETPSRPSGHALFRYVVKHPSGDTMNKRIREHLSIELKQPVYRPLHQLVDYDSLPVSEKLHQQAFMLPVHSAMNKNKAREVVKAIKDTSSRISSKRSHEDGS